MSLSTDRGTAAGTARIRVDRVACTGHGICAQLLPNDFTLDEWGYPLVRRDLVPESDAAVAVKLCPAHALWAASAQA